MVQLTPLGILVYMGFYWDNGKSNGNYRDYRDYIGIIIIIIIIIMAIIMSNRISQRWALLGDHYPKDPGMLRCIQTFSPFLRPTLPVELPSKLLKGGYTGMI